MPATHFPNIVAFIEGTMERIFVNNNMSYIDVVSIENGISWSPQSLAEQIRTKWMAKNANPDFVIVWLDREKRTESSAHIEQLIRNELNSAGVHNNRIAICVADRMTENIILADEALISDEFDLKNYEYKFDGQNGKNIMEGLYRKNGETYKETSEGVRLLKKMRLCHAAQNSASARQFMSQINLPCWWFGDATPSSPSPASPRPSS